MITLYDIPLSGNCHKIRQLLHFLDIGYVRHELDTAKREQKGSDYLRRNPFGQAPVLDDDGRVIRDSQAILIYLAGQYGGPDWRVSDPFELAQITAWLSTAANEIANGPARLRLFYKWDMPVDVGQATDTTDRILPIIDAHLDGREWLVGNTPTIADIAIYPYLALTNEGRVDLSPHTHLLDWCARFESLPKYLSMPGMTTHP